MRRIKGRFKRKLRRKFIAAIKSNHHMKRFGFLCGEWFVATQIQDGERTGFIVASHFGTGCAYRVGKLPEWA